MSFKDWKIIRRKKEGVWFQNTKDETEIVEVSKGTIQTGDKFEPYERIWKLYIPNRMGGKTYKTKAKAMKFAKKYMICFVICFSIK